MKEITIANSNISIKEYNGQRVVTLKDIDMVHNRTDGTARRNFNANRHRFIIGEDYFKVCANEIRTRKIMNISNKTQEDVTLITESGYLMLVKSFTDDLSWKVQRELVKSYFRLKEVVSEPKQSYICTNKTFTNVPVMTISDVSLVFSINYHIVYLCLKNHLINNDDYKVLEDVDLATFKKENPNNNIRNGRHLVVIFPTGLLKIVSRYNLDENKIPEFMMNHSGFVLNESVRRLMGYIRREIKGIEALTYLLESNDTPQNLRSYSKSLCRKLNSLRNWSTDVQVMNTQPHMITLNEVKSIAKGEYGIY